MVPRTERERYLFVKNNPIGGGYSPVCPTEPLVKKVIVEIEVETEDIVFKYPNYRFNYDTPQEFMETELLALEHKDNMEYGMKEELSMREPLKLETR